MSATAPIAESDNTMMPQTKMRELIESLDSLRRPTVDDLRANVEALDSNMKHDKSLASYLWQWAWRGDVEQVIEYIRSMDTSSTGQCFQVMHASLLLSLGRNEEAESVVEVIQQSKMVAAKVLCAVVTFGWNERSTAVDMLFKVLAALKPHVQHSEPLLDLFGTPLGASGIARWRTRIFGLLVSSYAASGNYAQAMNLCETCSATVSESSERHAALLQLARLRLQIGDVEAAKSIVANLKSNGAVNESPEDRIARRLLEGLIEYASGNYVVATNLFEQMRAELPAENTSCWIEHSGHDLTDSLLLAQDDRVIANVVEGVFTVECPLRITLSNNLALCYLNSCNLSRAIDTLEDCIVHNPARNMQRALVFNLCTLYDLAKPKPQSVACKEDLRRLAAAAGVLGRFNDSKDFRL